METIEQTPKQRIEETAARLGLEMAAQFVPWSQSRNSGEKLPSLNWRIVIMRQGRHVLTTDYSAGCGHCPSYKARQSVDDAEAIRKECETGYPHKAGALGAMRTKGNQIMPELADVLHSLMMDADAIERGAFEEWAAEFGYDTDSRRAENTYRACLEIGLALRAALGDKGLAELREACIDY